MMDAYELVVESGVKKVDRCRLRLPRTCALGLLAGVLISLGNAVMLVVRSDQTLPPAVSAVLSGACFSVGLAAVMLCGAELFTGDVLMFVGCRERRHGIPETCIVLWTVWALNLLGAMAASSALGWAGFHPSATEAVLRAKESLAPSEAFLRGVACNFLVCLAVWLGHMRTSVTDAFVAALLPVTTFVACGFEHSVANMYYLPMGGEAMVSNVLVVTLGNLVGGLAFCALMTIGRGHGTD